MPYGDVRRPLREMKREMERAINDSDSVAVG